MEAVLQVSGRLVASLNRNIFLEKPDDYAVRYKGLLNPPMYWFVSPATTGLEFAAVLVALALLIRALTRGSRAALWKVAIPARSPTWTPRADTGLAIADYGLRLVCVICAVLTVYYKIETNRIAYLLQPCHLSNFLLAALCFVDPAKSAVAQGLFFFNLNTSFGTLIALLAPDTINLRLPGEHAFFFSQHYMLLLLPLVWLLRRRYALYRGWRLTLLMWAYFAVMHWAAFLPTSILDNKNVNYMMLPPSVYPRALFPEFYRPIVLVACIGITFLVRHALLEPLLWLGGSYRDARREAAALGDKTGKPEEAAEDELLAAKRAAGAGKQRSQVAGGSPAGVRRRGAGAPLHDVASREIESSPRAGTE
jgi:hypothetical protein